MVEITSNKAKRIINQAFAAGKELGLKPLAVIVLDAGGHCKAFERQDGAAPGRFAIADGKANAAIQLGMPSSKLMQRAEQQAYFVGALNGVYGGRIIPVPGGVLVKDKKGRVIGAVGVTGDSSENDVLAAVAGIEAAGLVAEG
ncbi:MAG: heme-binding protein [Amylibacter sp.]|nr:heme-binding protein [Amylibacter sp.]